MFDFENVINTHRYMQAAVEQMVADNHSSISWNGGRHVKVWDQDIDFLFHTDESGVDFVNCSGVNYRQELFDFDIPADVLEEVIVARMGVAVG